MGIFESRYSSLHFATLSRNEKKKPRSRGFFFFYTVVV